MSSGRGVSLMGAVPAEGKMGVRILEPDDIAGPDHPRQFNGIPVRQADAAVGLRLANV